LKQKEGYRVEIQLDLAVAALPVIKDRRTTMFLFIHPEFMRSHRWDTAVSDKLLPVELSFLTGHKQPPDLEAVVRTMCRARQLINEYGVLTKEGRRILSHYRLD